MAIKYLIDALAAIDRAEGRTDAEGLTAFFSNELEQIRPELYEKKYPEFKARRFVPVKNDIHPGAEAYTERSIDEAGEAEFMTDMANDAPMVAVKTGPSDTYYMKGIHLAYGWHLQEMRNAQFAGRSLDTSKALACRRGIERFIDRGLLVGGVTGGRTLQGLFTLSGTQAPVTYTTDIVGSVSAASSDELYRLLMEMSSKGFEDSKEIEIPDTIIMPTKFKRLCMNRRMGDANNASVLKFFLESQDFIKNVETSHYLEASGGHGGAGGTQRLVVYKNDREMLEGLVNEFEQLPPEYKGAKVSTTCMARVGGIAARRPKSVTYADVTATI